MITSASHIRPDCTASRKARLMTHTHSRNHNPPHDYTHMTGVKNEIWIWKSKEVVKTHNTQQLYIGEIVTWEMVK